MNVLITAPSLNTKDNVSGISTVAGNIIRHSRQNFKHLELGSKDKKLFIPKWLFKQISIYARFLFKLHHIDIVHINTAFNPLSICRDYILILLTKIFGKKIIMHIHGGRYLMENCTQPFIKFAIKNSLKLSDVIIVLSNKESIIVSNLLKDKGKIYALPNCIDLGSIQPERSPRNPDIPLNIIFLGRIHESKGIDDIEEGIKKLNDCTKNFIFTLYGTGPLRERFIFNMRNTLNGRFLDKGVVHGDAKWKALNESDILLLPSRYGEGMPMSMLEAMATGNVVVVTDDASITTVIKDNINGRIVNKKDPQNICDTLMELIENPEKLKFISQNARKTIYNRYNLTDYISELDKIYSRI